MTKVSVLNLEESSEIKAKKIKPIEFCLFVCTATGTIEKSTLEPNHWDNVKLVAKMGSGCRYDVIIGWNDDSKCVSTYLGYWNDGVVE